MDAAVCIHPRTSYFAKCNVSVILPHKSASAMLLGQFEDICGKATEQIGGHYSGEHVQDRLPTHAGEGATRRLDGSIAAQPLKYVSAHNEASKSSGCGEHNIAKPDLSRGGFLVFFYRDPRERAIGMYNILEAQDGSSPFMNKSDYDRVKIIEARTMLST
jgi:hypothetical protein